MRLVNGFYDQLGISFYLASRGSCPKMIYLVLRATSSRWQSYGVHAAQVVACQSHNPKAVALLLVGSLFHRSN